MAGSDNNILQHIVEKKDNQEAVGITDVCRNVSSFITDTGSDNNVKHQHGHDFSGVNAKCSCEHNDKISFESYHESDKEEMKISTCHKELFLGNSLVHKTIKREMKVQGIHNLKQDIILGKCTSTNEGAVQSLNVKSVMCHGNCKTAGVENVQVLHNLAFSGVKIKCPSECEDELKFSIESGQKCNEMEVKISNCYKELLKGNHSMHDGIKREAEEQDIDNSEQDINVERQIQNNTTQSVTYHNNSNISKCPHCGEDFSNLSDFKRHLDVCFERKQHFCNECNLGFVSAKLVKEHKKRHKVNLACDKCDKTFGTRNGYKNHLKIHSNEKLMQCTSCDAIFSQVGHLNRHMRTHTGEKPYQCKVCDAKFSQSGSLKHHMKLHSGEKHFKCVHCDASFSHSGHFNQHMRQHTGEKPYKCVQCGLSYSRSGSLKQHMRTHTGDMPYKCPLCNRGFTRSTILDKHVRTHTGEKPFKCFSRADRLKQHMKSHVQDGKV